MGVIFGAFKGMARGAILLVFFAVFPGVAWLVASHAESTWGVEFVPVFAGVLVLEAFFGACAIVGMAPELEKHIGDAIDREVPGGGPR
jgi:hypothetical protein